MGLKLSCGFTAQVPESSSGVKSHSLRAEPVTATAAVCDSEPRVPGVWRQRGRLPKQASS